MTVEKYGFSDRIQVPGTDCSVIRTTDHMSWILLIYAFQLSTGDSCRYMLSGSIVAKCRCANNEQCVWVFYGAQGPSKVNLINSIKSLLQPVYDAVTNNVCALNK